MKQISFGFVKNFKKEFGGSLLKGRRKEKRPLSTKHPIHLILKSCEKGVFAPTNQSLQKLILKTAAKFHIHIYEYASNWSHIHLVIRIYRRENYIVFIRALTSILALKLRARGLKKVFNLRPYTRILNWGRDFKNALNYQVLNQLEAMGFIKRPEKKKKRNVGDGPQNRRHQHDRLVGGSRRRHGR